MESLGVGRCAGAWRVLVLVVWFVVLGGVARPLTAQGWVDVTDPSNTPGGTVGAGMCYYPQGGYCLLLKDAETWAYDAQGWRQLHPANPPVPQTQQPALVAYQLVSMAADPASGRVLALVAYQLGSIGINGAQIFEWDGVDWYAGPHLGESGSYYLRRLISTDSRCLLVSGQCSTSVPGFEVSEVVTGPVGTPAVLQLVSASSAPGFPASCGFSLFSRSADPSIWALLESYDNVRRQSQYSMWRFDPSIPNWSQCSAGATAPLNGVLRGSFGDIATVSDRDIHVGIGQDWLYPYTISLGPCATSIMSLAQQPSLRFGYSIAYDPIRSVVLMHGGASSAGRLADTWELRLGPAATSSPFGAGCAGIAFSRPTIAPLGGSSPQVGSNFQVSVRGLPWGLPTYMMLGLSNTSYGGASLPLSLAPFGAPGCSLLIDGLELYPVPNILGLGVWQTQIPNLPGFTFYNQAVCLDPAANQLGLVLSNGLESVVGM